MDGSTRRVDRPPGAALAGRRDSSASMTTSRRISPRYHDRQEAASWPRAAGCSPRARIPPIPASTSGRSRTALSAFCQGQPSAFLRAAVPPPLTAPLISPSCRGSAANAADRGPAQRRRTMKQHCPCSPDARWTCPHSIVCPGCGAKPWQRCKRQPGHPCAMHTERYRKAESAMRRNAPASNRWRRRGGWVPELRQAVGGSWGALKARNGVG